MSGFRGAVALLTRVPVGAGDWATGDASRSLTWVPLVGALIGLVVGSAYAGLKSILPSLLASGLAVLAGVLITGALHEDGLADTADGFGGGSGREEKLRIMKDPAHGTYGTVALVASLLLRIGALSTITPGPALVLLPVVHSLSRGGAIALMAILPAATGDGLGAAYVDRRLAQRVAVGSISSMAIALLLLGWWVLPFLVVALSASAGIGALARRQISGFTGDVIGAAQQVGEVSLLVLGAALVDSGALEIPWWS